MALNLQFTSNDWKRIKADYTAWWAGELDRAIVLVDYISSADDARMDPLNHVIPTALQAMSIDEYLGRTEERLSATQFLGDAIPSFFVYFGAGLLAAPLGCGVNPQPRTVWFEEPEEKPAQLADLEIRFDESNPWWRRMLETTEKALARWGSQVCVTYTDMGGNLDILASLRGSQNLLMDCMDTPDIVAEKAAQITEIWIQQFNKLHEMIAPAGAGFRPWAPTWAPGKTYMLQSDFAYMISPEMFGRFVMPDLRRCCDELDYGFYHLDGTGQIPHVDQLLSIKRLRGIQWIPGDGTPPPSEWPDLIAKIRDAGKLVQLYGTFSEVMSVLDQHGGKGFLFHAWPDPGTNPSKSDIQAFIDKAMSY